MHLKGRGLRGGSKSDSAGALENVDIVAEGGFCRLEMPWRLAVVVTTTSAGPYPRGPEVGGTPAPSNASLPRPPPLSTVPGIRRGGGGTRRGEGGGFDAHPIPSPEREAEVGAGRHPLPPQRRGWPNNNAGVQPHAAHTPVIWGGTQRRRGARQPPAWGLRRGAQGVGTDLQPRVPFTPPKERPPLGPRRRPMPSPSPSRPRRARRRRGWNVHATAGRVRSVCPAGVSRPPAAPLLLRGGPPGAGAGTRD